MKVKQQLALVQWNAMVFGQVLSPLNVWSTGEIIKRSPDPNDRNDRLLLHEHFIESGGRDRFADEFEIATDEPGAHR